MLTISSANVNGIRAAAKKGLTQWLAATAADIVCLQEVRAEQSEHPAELQDPEGWHTLLAPSEVKGRSGVAIYTREAPSATRIGFGSAEFDAAGRYAEVDLANVTVGSLYLPSGEAETPRQAEKERFMAEFFVYLKELRERSTEQGREVLVCGDWNIAHQEVDIKNWKANQKSAGFLPEERAWFTRVLDDAGYIDVVRQAHPEGPGPYSWWSNRGQAFTNDVGWRIDLILTTPNVAQTATSAVVERAATYAERWSDHAPVTCVFDWDIAAVPAPRSPIGSLAAEELADLTAES